MQEEVVELVWVGWGGGGGLGGGGGIGVRVGQFGGRGLAQAVCYGEG